MCMQAIELIGYGLLRRAIFLITLPGFFVKMEYYSIAGRLDHR